MPTQPFPLAPLDPNNNPLINSIDTMSIGYNNSMSSHIPSHINNNNNSIDGEITESDGMHYQSNTSSNNNNIISQNRRGDGSSGNSIEKRPNNNNQTNGSATGSAPSSPDRNNNNNSRNADSTNNNRTTGSRDNKDRIKVYYILISLSFIYIFDKYIYMLYI